MRKFVIAMLLMTTTSATALDLTQVIKGPSGLPMKDNFEEDTIGCVRDPRNELSCKPDLTVGRVIFNGLIFVDPNDRAMTQQQKFKRGELARHIYKATDVTFSAEEITMIKEAVGKVYSPLVVYDTIKLLDPGTSGQRLSNETR